MPADRSSSIPAALTHLTQTDPRELQDADAPHLLAYLPAIPDPRARSGRRHPLVAILALAAAAVLAGARSFAAIAEWAADAPQPVRAALGACRDGPDYWAVPAETTIRRTLARLDADTLAAAVGAWLADRTHADAAEFLVGDKQAHYLFCVKANQPTLLARLKRLPWHRVPVADRTRDRGHGRIEHRTLKVVTVHHIGFPHAAQVLQVTRKTHTLRTRRWRTVIIYAITSLGFEQARPVRLADLLRGHWAIEALHQLRDVTFAEDASRVRSGAGPSVMATLRNLVIGVLYRAGPVNLAAALRRDARDPRRPLATLGISLG